VEDEEAEKSSQHIRVPSQDKCSSNARCSSRSMAKQGWRLPLLQAQPSSKAGYNVRLLSATKVVSSPCWFTCR
jgi:hypothetical protein